MSQQSQEKRSRLDPEPVPRRDFLGMAALGAAGATLAFATAGMARLPNAAVASSPSKKFKVNIPENWAEGTVFIPPDRSVALYRDAEGIYAISLICTHLGCIVKPTAAGFECPCHGSGFTADGSVSKGPALKALPWRKVVLSGGACIIDEDSVVSVGTKVKA
jgi:Rieske Fe-S protein